MAAYYIYKNEVREGPFLLEELKDKELSKFDLVWKEGLPTWTAAKDLPEVNNLLVPPLPPPFPDKARKHKRKGTVIALILSLLIATGSTTYYYFNITEDKKVSKINVPVKLSTDELYEKYKNSIVLIKHAYAYKMNVNNTDLYFTGYDKTGNISGLTPDIEEVKKALKYSYGTGFLIDTLGMILTNRHVVDVIPSKEDQYAIILNMKQNANAKLLSIVETRSSLENRLGNISNYLSNNNEDLTIDNYYKLKAMQSEWQEDIDQLNKDYNFYSNISAFDFDGTNFIKKITIQFGFFDNEKYYRDLNDYTKAKIVRLSDDEAADLALIVSNEDKTISSLTPISLSRIVNRSTDANLKVGEKVYMIGFNYGPKIAKTSSGLKAQVTLGNVSQASTDKILYSIPALSGSSGSPVFDEYGNLVSVNFAGVSQSQSFNYGVAPEKIRNFLNR